MIKSAASIPASPARMQSREGAVIEILHNAELYWEALQAECENWCCRFAKPSQPDTNKRTGKSSAARKSVSRRAPGGGITHLSELPANFKLKEAFSKKNWKLNPILDRKTRIRLNQLAEDITNRQKEEQSTSHDNATGMSSHFSADPSSTAVTHNAHGQEQRMLIVNPQSREIREAAEECNLSPEAVTR